jgi:4-amino-4-deoxy-L-arabinose transferase-like glycosyltransferase
MRSTGQDNHARAITREKTSTVVRAAVHIRSRQFTHWVIAWTAIGLAVRVGYVLLIVHDKPLGGDPQYFHGLAEMLRHGRGWNDPYLYGFGRGTFPTATHPPLYSFLLAGSSFLGFGSELGHRLFSCAIGTLAIPLVAVVTRRYAGVRAAVIAAGLTALYPYLWTNDAELLSESLLAVLIALVLLVAERTARTGSLRRGVWLGVVIGLAAITRGEQLLLVPLLAWPLLLRGAEPVRARLIRAAAASLATLLVIVPWTGWNLTRFEHPVFISTNFGGTLFNTNCDRLWHGDLIGWWSFLPPCPNDVGPEVTDESTRDHRLRSAGWTYVRGHLRRLPVVVAARVGRIWGVFNPRQTRQLDERGLQARWTTRTGFFMFYPLLVFGVIGLLRLRRRRVSVLPFVAMAAVVTVTAAVFYGAPRFRVPVDVAMVVLGAIGIDAIIGARIRDPETAPQKATTTASPRTPPAGP